MPAHKKIVQPTDEFPDFLTWREMCCAYVDLEKFRPDDGGPWVNRAKNTWYLEDAYKKLQKSNRLIFILPPGHLKTTFFGIEFLTWSIMSDPDRKIRILVVQKNENEAKKLVAEVQARLSDDEHYEWLREQMIARGIEPIVNPLRQWFKDKPFKGNQRRDGTTWGAISFSVLGKRGGEKDLTMQAAGAGGNVQGMRSDIILLDDVQDPMANAADTEEKWSWMRKVILGRIKPSQKLIYAGNYFAPEDLAHKLIAERGDVFGVTEYPALRRAGLGGAWTPTCPEFWSLAGLKDKRKEVGEEVWHYTWMQETGSFDEQTFKREVLQDARNTDFKIGEVPYGITDLYIGCDPATAPSGYCAIVVWGLDRNSKQRYLVDVFNEKGMRNVDNVVAQLVEMTRRYQPRKVIVEGNAQQKAFVHSDQFQRAIRSLAIRYEVYQTVTGSGGRAKASNYDITTIGALFDGGMVSLPYGGTDKDRARTDEYIDQLCAWRTDSEGNSIKHLQRDMVMATLFAESEAYIMANRPDRPTGMTTRRNIPNWVKGQNGGWSWMDKRRQREPV